MGAYLRPRAADVASTLEMIYEHFPILGGARPAARRLA